MKVIFVDKYGVLFHPSYDFSYEKLLIEKLIHKGFRPMRGDYFHDQEGNAIKIKYVQIVDENNLILSIIP